ncbi:MAG: cyclic lactone autoinducer peptide [Bacilli bacterium]|nr:cyclic lactone autoinducer peptide [Bacilli bacterium]
MKFIADILAAIGNGAAATGTQGCMLLFIDEPKMPKALLEK